MKRWTALLAAILALGGAAFAAERFVAPAGGWRAAAVELAAEATVDGAEVPLKAIARWAEPDDALMAPAGDLVIARFAGGETAREISLAEVRDILEGAGMNLATVNFSGAGACRVQRRNASPPPAPVAPAPAAPARAASSSTPVAIPAAPWRDPAVAARSLRQLLIADLASRLAAGEESLSVRFNAQDERLLSLTDDAAQFDVAPARQNTLGDVAWDVTIRVGELKQPASIRANARLWQAQLVAVRPIAYKQAISADDLAERRVLVERVPDEPALRIDQAVGQQAARDIPVGLVLNGRMLEAVQLVRRGELVTVTMTRGAISLTWVAEARENGALGQAIRVRKPQTREDYSIVVTGQQQGRLVGVASDPLAGRH